MDIYLSHKFTFFSFWLIILVVLLHSLNIDFNNCDNMFCTLQYLLSYKLAQVAVPLFFMISGYLFFLNLDPHNSKQFSMFGDKIAKRFKTLFIPYLLWCVIWFAFMYVIQLLPLAKGYFIEPLNKMSVIDLLLQFIIYPLNYPFWFLRQLIVFVMISPIIYYIIHKLNYSSLILVLIINIFYSGFIEIGVINIIQTSALFFFMCGAYLGLKKITPKVIISNKKLILIIVIWLALNVISSYLDKIKFDAATLNVLMNRIKDIIGCFAIWQLYDVLNFKGQWRNYTFYKYSFFIFAFHGIPLLFLKKVLDKIFPHNPLLDFLSYLLIFISIVFLSTFFSFVIEKYFNKTYKILTGGR